MSFTYITGSGTQADPYVISDKDGWNEFCNHVNNGNSMVGQFVELAADIRYNTSDDNVNGYVRRVYTETTPTIGTYDEHVYNRSFRGDFNGNNHILYGFNVKNTGCVISASNGAHIHHVRFEKIIASETRKYENSNNKYYACVDIKCNRDYIVQDDSSTHIKQNGCYVVLNDIVCSATVNFLTVKSSAFVTLKNILYSCDSIFEGNDIDMVNGDSLPYYLAEVISGLDYINLNFNTDNMEYNNFLRRLSIVTIPTYSIDDVPDLKYIIKDNELYVHYKYDKYSEPYKYHDVEPTIIIENCTSYNSFLTNLNLRRDSQYNHGSTQTSYECILRNSVSYFPNSEFYNYDLQNYEELTREDNEPQGSTNHTYNYVHKLAYHVRDQLSGYALYSATPNDDIYCRYLNDNIGEHNKQILNDDVLYINGYLNIVYNSYGVSNDHWELNGSISFPNNLKARCILVSDMYNTYINSLREIMSDKNGKVYSTTDTITEFQNSTTMSFSSDLNCYVPVSFANEYVYWNIKSTPDNYKLFYYGTQNYKRLWCNGNFGLIRKGTDVNFGIGCIDEYKNPFLSAIFTANGSSISYTFDEDECHSETYSNVTTSMNIDVSIIFGSTLSGNGTSQSPYLISNSNELEAFLWFIHYFGFESNLSNVKRYFKDTYFKLTSDITLQDSSTINSLSAPDSGIYFPCTPDETDFAYSYPSRDSYYGCFCGTFDGNNHSIFGLYDQYFHMGECAVIKNLYFVVCNIVFFMNSENLIYDMYYKSENPPTIIDSYLSGYIDFSIWMGHIRRCVIHNLKYYNSGYNMIACDHYPYNIPDEQMEYNTESYTYSYPFTFIEPDVEFSDCLFMENASNILPTSTFGRMTYDNDNITGDIAVGKCINTPCYNMFNNVYLGTYENAIFSPYHIYCEDRYGEVYENDDASDEILIIKESRKEVANTYKNKYKTLYVKSSSLLRHERINNCGSIIDDKDWNTQSSFRTLDFTSTWKMTEIGPVPKKLNIVTHSITVSCSNVYDRWTLGICRIDKLNTSISSYTSDNIALIDRTPNHLRFLKWDDTDSTNASRSFDYSSGSQWITFSMRTNETYSGGDGTKDNPYQLSVVDDIYDFLSFKIDDDVDSSFGFMPYMYYVLTTDLEMNDVSDYDILNPEPYEDYTPVRRIFYGDFDGRNHHISGLNPRMFEFPTSEEIEEDPDILPYTAMGDFVGLSSFILHFSGKLKNLIIDKVYIPITENAFICGGIVCYAYAGNNPDVTEITNCKFMGVIDHCYMNGLCGGIFAVTADSLCYSNFLRPIDDNNEGSLQPFIAEYTYCYSLVYETFFMNLDTQKIVIDNCDTVGSIKMSELIPPQDIYSYDIISYINNNLPHDIITSVQSWFLIKFVSGFCNYCYEQGLPLYIQNSVNNMNVDGFITSGLCTSMNMHKPLSIFIENSFNTGNITVTNLMPDVPSEQASLFTASGLMTSFSASYINIKNCYNNGEISAYTVAGIHMGTSSVVVSTFKNYGLNYMPLHFYMKYHIENCYNYNNIIPLYDSDHTYAIEPPCYNYQSQQVCEPINCYSLENTTTDDTNQDVTYISSDEFKVKSNFTDWDFNNTWSSPTAKNRPLLSENLEGDNLYRLKLSVNNKGFGTATGAGAYEENTIVELLAVPFTSYKFEAWSDGNKKNPRNYVVDHNEYIQAIFRFDGYSIRLLDYEGLKRFRDNMKNYIREENDKKVDIVMAGDSDTPVYFNSAGIPTPCTALDLNTSGNAGSATKLETSRNISGVPFDGTTDITLTPSNIGLGNVNNTSDLDKPISNATQNALMLLESDIDKVSYDNITYRMIDDIFNS